MARADAPRRTRRIGRPDAAKRCAQTALRGAPRSRVLVAIRADLERVARACGRPAGVAPSIDEYRAGGRYSEHWVAKKITGHRGWRAAMAAAGLHTPFEVRVVRSREAIEDLRRVARLCAHPSLMPSPAEYAEHGRYSVISVCRALAPCTHEPWHGAACVAGLTPQGKRHTRLTQARVLADYRRAAARCGCTPGGYGPTTAEFGRLAGYTHKTAALRFGREWAALVTAAGYVPRPPRGAAAQRVQVRAALPLAA